jgi:FHA domain
MEFIDAYKERADTLTERAFVERLPAWILLKRGRKQTATGAPTPTFNFETTTTQFLNDPAPHLWQLALVKKRADNPFPERLSVGRAPNCDVVLRLPFISKVHAHLIVLPDGSLELRDNESTHETSLKGKRLAPREARQLKLGDQLSFGSLTLELVDGASLYRILRQDLPTSVRTSMPALPGKP